ncbi:DNA polymerase IV [Schnuerera sp. xch1]|uniref:DNA polymerase IV n=1 Tax=Schnuerera sp. xch1 TaxID=2874283 RepID=UPI001CBEBCF0|nr:DNA polymerase IV [Schnuerera sp. xch1]MBZ2175329.1 DNA polymerase IV [Schnuerera sp. xch1]
MNKSIIHVDMDAFYASIEQRNNPNLMGKPVIIGGISDRGVVCTASYEAREYGVHSAMSIKAAKRLCPNGIYLPVRMEEYKKESRKILKIFNKYSDIVEPLSIDEAFLDVTGKKAVNIAKHIKKDIGDELKLTASIGISINKFLAKIASDINKPNGLTIIKKEEVIEFLKPLSVTKLWGVGPKTKRELNKLGIYYIGDIQAYDLDLLISMFGKRGKELYDFSYGLDSRPVENRVLNRSIGEEGTFQRDVKDINKLIERLEHYSINTSRKLVSKGYLIKTITVKIKYSDFSMETRSMTLSIPTNDHNVIFETSKRVLMTKFNLHKSVRLIGLILINLIYPKDPKQLSMKI